MAEVLSLLHLLQAQVLIAGGQCKEKVPLSPSVLPPQPLQSRTSLQLGHTCPQPCAQGPSIYFRPFSQSCNIIFVQTLSIFPEPSQLDSPSFLPKFHNSIFLSLHEQFFVSFMAVSKPIFSEGKTETGRNKSIFNFKLSLQTSGLLTACSDWSDET